MLFSRPACLECRSVKIKCRLSPLHDICDRCQSKSLRCVFERHRRGRKPGTRYELCISFFVLTLLKTSRLKRKLSTSISPSHEPSLSLSSERSDCQHDTPQLQQKAPPSSIRRIDVSGNSQWENEGLQPASILSKATRSGKFSLEN